MTQKDRETYLNEAYDGFLDLAHVMSVPAKAMSLGGTLGLAFGSRGKGGRKAALAHFEPGNNAINLTRMRGAGSMAHEFGHAFANYLFRSSRGIQGSRSPGDITETLSKQVTRQENEKPLEGGQLRQVVTDAIGAILKSLKFRPAKPGSTQTLVQSHFYRGAENADAKQASQSRSRKSKKEPYWATIEEMFARGFETYVDAALKSENKEFRNDFLVRPDKLNVWGSEVSNRRDELEKSRPKIAELSDEPTKEEHDAVLEARSENRKIDREIGSLTSLYPAGDELEKAKKAFDKLFEVLETQEHPVLHEHLGDVKLPMLYSHDSSSITSISEREQNILAQCVMNEIARMCGREVWVTWHENLDDEQGNLVSGRYSEHEAASKSVRSVIELAYGAPMGTAHHEAFHFAQNHLLTENEMARLDADFRPEGELLRRLTETLIEEGKHDLAIIAANDPREAQAYAYELWVQGKLDMKLEDRPLGVFGRIRKFFDRALGISENAGFKTSHELFQAFHQGQLLKRQQLTVNRTLTVENDTDAKVSNSPREGGQAAGGSSDKNFMAGPRPSSPVAVHHYDTNEPNSGPEMA
jgi:hypothetical protein